jgi:midasin
MLTFTYEPQCWKDADTAVNGQEDRILFYGPPGTGKTYFGLKNGVGDAGSFRLICTEDMTTFDVVGGYLPNRSGGMTFHEGAALRAWQAGGRLVIDEIDLASPDVLAQLLAMTDSNESAEMLHPDTGQIVRPAPGFSVVATTNMLDPNELPAALRDRFVVAINIDQAHPDAIATLDADLQKLAAELSAAEPNRRASIRAFKSFARLRKSTPIDNAARIVFGERKAKAIADALKIEALETR